MGRVVPVLALRQNPGPFWGLGNLSYQPILEKSCSQQILIPQTLHFPSWRQAHSTAMQLLLLLAFQGPQKNHMASLCQVVWTLFVTSLPYRAGLALSFFPFVPFKSHPVLHSEIKSDRTAGLSLNSLGVPLWPSCDFTRLFPLVPNCRHTLVLC